MKTLSKKTVQILLLMFVAAFLMFFLVVFDRSDEKKAEIAKRMELVGESVVLRGDTLEIIKYNVWHKKYILEDGHYASHEMAAVLLIRH